MCVRLLQTRQSASLNLHLLARPLGNARSRCNRRIVVGYAADLPIYEICVALDDEPWQKADPLRLETFRTSRAAAISRDIPCILDGVRRDDWETSKPPSWKSIILASVDGRKDGHAGIREGHSSVAVAGIVESCTAADLCGIQKAVVFLFRLLIRAIPS
jgi:hypothetical protein